MNRQKIKVHFFFMFVVVFNKVLSLKLINDFIHSCTKCTFNPEM